MEIADRKHLLLDDVRHLTTYEVALWQAFYDDKDHQKVTKLDNYLANITYLLGVKLDSNMKMKDCYVKYPTPYEIRQQESQRKQPRITTKAQADEYRKTLTEEDRKIFDASLASYVAKTSQDSKRLTL